MKNKKPSYNLKPYKNYEKAGYTPSLTVKIKMTTGANKILDKEQAKMLVQMIAHEFKTRPELNHFSFPKVGLIVLKDKNNLTIMTEQEKKETESE